MELFRSSMSQLKTKRRQDSSVLIVGGDFVWHKFERQSSMETCCSVIGCKSMQTSSEQRCPRLHPLPSVGDPLRDEWIARCRRADESGGPWKPPTRNVFFCSDHFKPACFVKVGKGNKTLIRLKPGSVPTEFQCIKEYLQLVGLDPEAEGRIHIEPISRTPGSGEDESSSDGPMTRRRRLLAERQLSKNAQPTRQSLVRTKLIPSKSTQSALQHSQLRTKTQDRIKKATAATVHDHTYVVGDAVMWKEKATKAGITICRLHREKKCLQQKLRRFQIKHTELLKCYELEREMHNETQQTLKAILAGLKLQSPCDKQPS